MFLRFVVTRIHADSHQPQGLFATTYNLLDGDDLSAEEKGHLRELLVWFDENLPSPDDLRITDRAVFWYRASAQECIGRMWELANALRVHDYDVEVLKCRQLGNQIYQDKYQVAAIPSRWDSRITAK